MIAGLLDDMSAPASAAHDTHVEEVCHTPRPYPRLDSWGVFPLNYKPTMALLHSQVMPERLQTRVFAGT